jgi:hypothetical protein
MSGKAGQGMVIADPPDVNKFNIDAVKRNQR